MQAGRLQPKTSSPAETSHTNGLNDDLSIGLPAAAIELGDLTGHNEYCLLDLMIHSSSANRMPTYRTRIVLCLALGQALDSIRKGWIRSLVTGRLVPWQSRCHQTAWVEWRRVDNSWLSSRLEVWTTRRRP